MGFNPWLLGEPCSMGPGNCFDGNEAVADSCFDTRVVSKKVPRAAEGVTTRGWEERRPSETFGDRTRHPIPEAVPLSIPYLRPPRETGFAVLNPKLFCCASRVS